MGSDLTGRVALITGAAGGIGRAIALANAVLFLASEKASFVTAEILNVNGGMWAD